MQVTKNYKWMSLVALLVVAFMSASCAGGAGVTTGPSLSFRPSGSDSNNTVDGGATTIGTGSGGYTGGGGGSLDTDLNLPGGGGGSTTTPSGSAYTPAITVPPVESFANDAAPSDDDVTAWLKNCYETLPQGSSGVFQNASLQGWAMAIFDETNRVRVAAGLQPLEYESNLEALAQAHARDMALRDYFSHDCPDGVLMWDRWMALNIPYAEWAGENAAMGQETAVEVVQQWMQSSGHRRNMMHESAQYCGVGVYFDASDRDMPIKVIVEYADFREDQGANDWYQFGDVYRQ